MIPQFRIIALAILALGLLPGWFVPQIEAAEPIPPSGTQRIGADYRADRAVVRICNTVPGSRSYGSGTYIEENGQPLILTCSHLFRDGVGQIAVGFPGGHESKAQLLASDEEWDLAILSIPRPSITPVKIATDYPEPGDAITSYGWGKDCRLTQSPGKVIGYVATLRTGLYETLYTSSRGSEGNSGGPILNNRNELVAVCWGGINEVHGTFCDRVRRFLRSILGRPPPGCPPEGCKGPNIVDVLPGINPLPDKPLFPVDQDNNRGADSPYPPRPGVRGGETSPDVAGRFDDLRLLIQQNAEAIAALAGCIAVPGPPGEAGQPGPQGLPGEDGISPTIDLDDLAAKVLAKLPQLPVRRQYMKRKGTPDPMVPVPGDDDQWVVYQEDIDEVDLTKGEGLVIRTFPPQPAETAEGHE